MLEKENTAEPWIITEIVQFLSPILRSQNYQTDQGIYLDGNGTGFIGTNDQKKGNIQKKIC